MNLTMHCKGLILQVTGRDRLTLRSGVPSRRGYTGVSRENVSILTPRSITTRKRWLLFDRRFLSEKDCSLCASLV